LAQTTCCSRNAHEVSHNKEKLHANIQHPRPAIGSRAAHNSFLPSVRRPAFTCSSRLSQKRKNCSRTFSFSTKSTTRCAGNIPNGFSLMATVPCAKRTNPAWRNCWAWLLTSNRAPLLDSATERFALTAGTAFRTYLFRDRTKSPTSAMESDTEAINRYRTLKISKEWRVK